MSARARIAAVRPATLVAAVPPVAVGTACARATLGARRAPLWGAALTAMPPGGVRPADKPQTFLDARFGFASAPGGVRPADKPQTFLDARFGFASAPGWVIIPPWIAAIAAVGISPRTRS